MDIFCTMHTVFCVRLRLPAYLLIVASSVLLAGVSAVAQPQGGPPSQPSGHARIGEVLSDRTIDWRDPQQRAEAVERIREIEIANKERARERADAMGIPMRRVLPDGTEQEIIGLDEDGEFLIYSTHNADAAISSAANLLHPAPYSLDGSGVTVGVWDGGAVRDTHTEFQTGSGSRVTIMDGAGLSNHGTHVGGTVGARGASVSRKGMAPNVLIDSYDWGSDISEMTQRAASEPGQEGKIPISNHSYGFVTGWFWNGSNWEWTGSGTDQNGVAVQFGQYTAQARDWDNIVYNAPYYLIFKSAGNDNNDNPANGNTVIIGGNSVTYDSSSHPPGDGVYRNGYENISHAGNSKNIMTVGAANDAVTNGQRDPSKSTIANFSSRGPTDDGRIKPDIVANGVGLSSTSSSGDTAYTTMGGTSMSSPSAAGSAALLVQLYRDLFDGGAMRASTLKGLIIHTATDLGAYGIGNVGPDYHYGWGLINVHKAADLIVDQYENPLEQRMTEDVLNTATPSRVYTFNWDGVSPIRATLSWTDPAGTATSTHDLRDPRLVNDLDLKIIAPDGTEYLPWVMPFVGTWTVESMSLPATTGTNSTDNVEQVLIEDPEQSGVWQVEITHKGSLTNNEQVYSLLLDGLTSRPVEMEVSRGGSNVAAGGVDGVSGLAADVGSQITYTISNVGGGALELTTPVTISGENNCSVTVNTQPASTLLGDESTSLVLTITPAAEGTWSFGVSVDSNDEENNPYSWTVTGIAGEPGIMTADFVAQADTYIHDRSADTNYGTETTIRVNNRTSGAPQSQAVLRGLLRFDLSAIPTHATVVSAKLDFVQDNGVSGLVNVVAATDSWNETTATWNNSQTIFGGTSFGSANTGTSAGSSVTITLNSSGASAVQGWISNPSGNNGFGLTTTHDGNGESNWLSLRSREFETESDRPGLTIEYEGVGIANAPLMVVTRDSQFLADGGTDSVSGTEATVGKQLTYAIGNLGDADLTLTTPITISGESNCSVHVGTQPSSPVSPSGSTELVFTVTPSAAGAWSATVSIASNDPDKDPYTWTISGTALGRYSVTYDANAASSGTVPTDPASPYLEGATVTVLGNTGNLLRDGFVFDGWNTAADGSGTNYAPGATFTMPSEDLTLYARWNAPPEVDAGPDQTVYLLPGADWTPASVLSKLVAWFDASDASSITIDENNNVSQWDDRSGNNNHATRVDTGDQPTYQASDALMNNMPSIGNPGLSGSVGLDTPSMSARNAYVVAYYLDGQTGTFSGYPTLFSGPGSNGEYRVMGDQNTANLLGTFSFNNAGTFKNGSTISSLNNVLPMPPSIFTFKSSASRTQVYSLGYNQVTAGRTWHGGYSEIIFTDGSEDLETQQKIEGYLAHKWGLAESLPVEHPYRLTQPGGDVATAYLSGTASDPDGDTLTIGWSVVGGPGAPVGFFNASALETTAEFWLSGDYTLRLTATDGFHQVDDEVVITVQQVYTVTYDGNGNTDGEVPTDQLSPYQPDVEVTVLGAGNLARTGYIFAGWNTAADGSGTSYDPDDTFMINSHTTLYAQWSGNTYAVTLDRQEGSGGSTSVQVTFGSPMPPADAPTRTGYTFNGYYTEIAGGGTQYYAADMSSVRNWDLPEDTVLYASWTMILSTVTYDGNDHTGGTVPTDASFYAYGEEVTVLGAGDLEKTGHTFSGWNTAADGTGTSYDPGDAFEIYADTTLYAQWVANTYTVTLDQQEGSGGSTSVQATFGSPMPAADVPTRTGYTFNGYYTEIDGGGTQYYTADMSSARNWDVPADTALYASWTLILSTVTYDGNDHTGGTVPTDLDSPYAYGATVTVLGEGELVKTGHIFAGWNTAADGSGSSYDPGDTFAIYADITLYAQWLDFTKLMPLVEDFEALDLGDLDGQNGWEASGVVVQTNTVREGSQAAEIIESDGLVRRTFTDAQTNVWTDFFVQPVLFEDAPSAIDPEVTVLLYFNADGHPVVYNGQEADVIETFTAEAGQWVRVTVHSDYVAQTWDLYLDEVPVRMGLGFYNTDLTHYTEFEVSGAGSASAYVDDIQIVLTSPLDALSILAPSGLSAEAVSSGQVDLSWTDNSDNEDGFAIERSLESGAGFVEIAAVGENVTTYSDYTVVPGETYYYRVLATNVTHRSLPSAEAMATTPKASATITLGDLEQEYDGSARPVSVATDPTGLTVVVTYNDNAWAPTNAGSYAVVATIDDATYQGTTNGTLVISKATPTATLHITNSPLTYDGSLKAAVVEVAESSVGGSVVNVANGTHTTAGTYPVTADFVPDDTANYETLTGLAAGDFVINKATPIVSVWPTASAIVLGEALSASELSGGSASPTGDFDFTAPATVPESGGTYPASVTFTPNDADNYTTVQNDVDVEVLVTVTFDKNAEEAEEPDPASKPVTVGAAYGDLATTSREGYTFNGWFTAAVDGDPVTTGTVVTATGHHTLYAQWTGEYTLTVISAHGDPVPSVGLHTYDANALVDASQPVSVIEEGYTQYVLTGWTGTGSDLSSGTGTNVSFTITEDTTLLWQWQTNYWVEFTLEGEDKGSLDAPAAGWYPSGTNLTATATLVDEYRYVQWQGDTDGAQIEDTAFSFTVQAPRFVEAVFLDYVTDYKSIPWWWLASLDPEREEWTPEDFEALASETLSEGGSSVWEAYWTGTDPTDASSRFEIGRVHIVDGKIQLEWSHAEGAPNLPQVYIEFRTNLLSGAWERIGVLSAEGGMNEWEHTDADVPGYYRLSVDIP